MGHGDVERIDVTSENSQLQLEVFIVRDNTIRTDRGISEKLPKWISAA